jgi:hypothetical protein
MAEQAAGQGDEQGAGVDPVVASILARPGDTVLWQTSYADGRPSVYCCVIGGWEVRLRTLGEYWLLVEGGVQLAFRWE